MKFSAIVLLIILICLPLEAQKVLYKSKTYSVESDRVIQGSYESVALSRDEMNSSYQSSYKINTSNAITFKFSINGLDNEREPGKDHHLIIIPVNGKFISPIYTFGKDDPAEPAGKIENLTEDTDLLIRLDMTDVLNDFNTKGYFKTYDGNKIFKKDFKGVYIAGNTAPLSWNFGSLVKNQEFKLTDAAGTGIYTITIHLNKSQFPGKRINKWLWWKLSRDISGYPAYKSPYILTDALYNQAMEEMLLNIRDDGAFMAGAKWTGIWTRDISYSIILSLAMVNPDASKVSLMAKVKNDRIIQDTGTGGAWPVSSDRLVWAVAAWEVYLATGDKDWLKSSYKIIKNSADDDLKTVYDESTGLFRGESSFLDWREQTYPRWMDPKDIYSSECLGTNAVHYEAFKVLAGMAKLLNEPSDSYLQIAEKLKDAINKHLWLEDKNYFGQYLYGRNFLSLSPRSESLGEALTVLFGICDNNRENKIISQMPVLEYGVPCIFPETPGIPPYHNNAIWPFVESFYAWASAKAGNTSAVNSALGSIYRAAALFMTNKENMVASTGDYLGTEINSDRQLWSVAGNLALIYRVIFGITLEPDSISFNPFIPKAYGGKRTLSNLNLRNSNLTITINGFGYKINKITLDGKEISGNKIPADMHGKHQISIQMNNQEKDGSSINKTVVHFAPETPKPALEKKRIVWDSAAGASEYSIYKNGKLISRTKDRDIEVENKNLYYDYQVASIDQNGIESFLSEPVSTGLAGNTINIQAETGNENIQTKYTGFSGNGYVVIDKNRFPDQRVLFAADILHDGIYSIDFRYANGSGPINTDNKCAIRTLTIDGERAGAVVFPQRGAEDWTNWGFSNSIIIKLKKGKHRLIISFEPSDNNMNTDTNTALLDYARIIKIK
jgi:hypothetical protein